jgi:hypothetical protein
MIRSGSSLTRIFRTVSCSWPLLGLSLSQARFVLVRVPSEFIGFGARISFGRDAHGL